MARRTLSQEVKQGILRDLAAGVSPVTIAATYNVTIPTVYNYRKSQLAAAQTTTTGVAAVTAAATPAEGVVATRRSAKASR